MGNGNKVEFLVAICALIASAMAVYMAWDQGRVMRAQQHGAVYPVLQVDGYVRNRPERTSVGLEIRNSGVGPALIEAVEFFRDAETPYDFRQERELLPPGFDLSWNGIVGRALAPGESVTPLDMVWPAGALDNADFRDISERGQSWRLEICYCSVFQRCWKTKQIGRSRATPVDKCVPQDEDLFERIGLQNLQNELKSSPVQEASE